MQALLSRWPNTPKVQLVTTDGFLFPNAVLEREGLMEKKGFPESYDQDALIRFLSAVKAGEAHVEAPVYSHLTYDVVPDERIFVDRPDILIVEGVNVLLPSRLPRDAKEIPFVSDFFDFSVYLHADEQILEKWYVDRFVRLRSTAFRDPKSYFRKYADLDDAAAIDVARGIWERINLRNLVENIYPTRARASLVLTKSATPPHRTRLAAEAIERVAIKCNRTSLPDHFPGRAAIRDPGRIPDRASRVRESGRSDSMSPQRALAASAEIGSFETSGKRCAKYREKHSSVRCRSFPGLA